MCFLLLFKKFKNLTNYSEKAHIRLEDDFELLKLSVCYYRIHYVFVNL